MTGAEHEALPGSAIVSGLRPIDHGKLSGMQHYLSASNDQPSSLNELSEKYIANEEREQDYAISDYYSDEAINLVAEICCRIVHFESKRSNRL